MTEAICMAIGFVLGVLTCVLAYERVFKLAARYQRTGDPAEPAPAKPSSAIPGIPVNPEVSAHRAIMVDARERGADHLQQMAQDAGQKISREEALLQAERMLRGESPLGGVS